MSVEDYEEFLASMPNRAQGATVESLDFITVEVSGGGVTTPMYFVMAGQDLTVTDPAITGGVFTAAQFEFKRDLTGPNPDQGSSILFVDETGEFRDLIDAIDLDEENPTLMTFRRYFSKTGDFSSPIEGPVAYEIVSFNEEGDVISVQCSVLDISRKRTGRTYNFQEYPWVRWVS